MGRFAEYRKDWEAAKKKAPDQKEAKKMFSKDLGPTLTELDGLAERLAAARGKKAYNPETILLLAPKVSAVGDKALGVARGYKAAAEKAGWKDVGTAAHRIANDLAQWLQTEAQQWKPDKAYIDLWRRATLELALSASGLVDAKSAEDLRKLLNEKTGAINQQRGDDAETKKALDDIARALSLLDPASAVKHAVLLDEKVQRIVKHPAQLAGVAPEARKDAAKIAGHVPRAKELAKKLQDLAKDDKVKQSPAAKSRADALLKDCAAALKAWTDAAAKANVSLAKLPQGM